jgi:uncharacterized membrane protein YdjX (TVP38/TMEM64 family)
VSRRSRIVGFGSAGLLVLAGIASAVAFGSALGQNLAFVLVALGLVLATCLVFYEVGLTEDHEREREATERERARAAKDPHPTERRTRTGLDRMRGRPRRLR